MTDETVRTSDPLQDHVQVRLFTLADYVADEPSGKLYISGAGLESVGVPVRLNPEVDGGLHFSCAVVLRLAFPRKIARETHVVDVLVRHADGSPAGPDSLFKVEMRFDLQRTPEDFVELSGNVPMQIRDYPLTASPDEVIFLHLVVDDILVGRLPVELYLAED